MARPFILIPAHNRKALTLGCLETLRAQGDLGRCTAMVVDDGSADDTGDAIRRQFPEVIVLDGSGELFWTGAMQLAMREARIRDSGTVIWLNDDCRPRPGAVAALCDYLVRHPRALAAPHCIDTASGKPVSVGFRGRQKHLATGDVAVPVDGVSGFCLGIGAEAAAELALPDAENFPHYYGDTAYTLKASRAGYPVTLLGNAVVELIDHHGGLMPLRARVARGKLCGAVWQETFVAVGSPYRLKTLFALQRLKYGRLPGTALATVRATRWIAAAAWWRVCG